jgi:hypothetical protein
LSNASIADFARISIGSASREALAVIEQAFQDEQERIDNRMFSAIDEGTATAEQALFAFAGKRALARVLLRLRQKDTTGQNAARRLAQHERVDAARR